MNYFSYFCSVEKIRNTNALTLSYSLSENEKTLVEVRYEGHIRKAEASWQSISAAMDTLMVPVPERITLLRSEVSKAPTVKLYNDYFEALKDLSDKQQAYEEYLQSTPPRAFSGSGRITLTANAKKASLRNDKIIKMREHFTPKVELSGQDIRLVLDNLVAQQYIAADSRTAFAVAMGWSDVRSGSNEMVIWQRNNYILRYMILTLLGKEETVIERPVMSPGSLVMLKPGIYGRRPILTPPTLNDRHWRLVASYFIDRKGRTINADSMRSTRYPVDPIENTNFKEELLSCFAPIFLSPAGRKLVEPITQDEALVRGRQLILQS